MQDFVMEFSKIIPSGNKIDIGYFKNIPKSDRRIVIFRNGISEEKAFHFETDVVVLPCTDQAGRGELHGDYQREAHAISFEYTVGPHAGEDDGI